MAISPMTFQVPTFEQSAPWLTGMQKVGNMQAQDAQTRNLMEQLKLLQAKAQYAPQMEQANLNNVLANTGYTNAGTDYLGQQTQWYGPKAQSDIGLQGAQAGKMRTETQFMPLEYAIKGAQAANSQDRFGGSYQLSKTLMTMSPSGRDEFRAQNPGAWNQMLTDLGNKAVDQKKGAGANVLEGQLKKFFPGSDESMAIPANKYQALSAGANGQGIQAQLNPQGLQQALQQPAQQGQIPLNERLNQMQSSQQVAPQLSADQELANVVPNAKEFRSTPANEETQKNISEYTVNDKMISPLQKKRRDSAITMEAWYAPNQKEYAAKIKNAADYAGLVGSGKRVSDEWLNKNQNKVADYDWYMNVFAPNSANQIKMMEQMGATDYQRKELNDMIKVMGDIKSNPTRAIAGVNNFMKTMQDVSDAVMVGAEPVHKGVTRKFAGIPKLEGNYVEGVPSITKQQTEPATQVLHGETYTLKNGVWHK